MRIRALIVAALIVPLAGCGQDVPVPLVTQRPAVSTTDNPPPVVTEQEPTAKPKATPRRSITRKVKPKPSITHKAKPKTVRKPKPKSVYYANCAAVRAAGAAPIRRGQPGYRSGLDRDGDGQGCGSD